MKIIMITFTEFVLLSKMIRNQFISLCLFIFILMPQYMFFYIAGRNQNSSKTEDRTKDQYQMHRMKHPEGKVSWCGWTKRHTEI